MTSRIDHDHFNNDKWGLPKGYTEQDRQGVWAVFRPTWNNPSYGFNDERRAVFLRTWIGPCDVVMADHRYFRTAPGGERDPGSNLLGSQQAHDWRATRRARTAVGPGRCRLDLITAKRRAEATRSKALSVDQEEMALPEV